VPVDESATWSFWEGHREQLEGACGSPGSRSIRWRWWGGGRRAPQQRGCGGGDSVGRGAQRAREGYGGSGGGRQRVGKPTSNHCQAASGVAQNRGGAQPTWGHRPGLERGLQVCECQRQRGGGGSSRRLSVPPAPPSRPPPFPKASSADEKLHDSGERGWHPPHTTAATIRTACCCLATSPPFVRDHEQAGSHAEQCNVGTRQVSHPALGSQSVPCGRQSPRRHIGRQLCTAPRRFQKHRETAH